MAYTYKIRGIGVELERRSNPPALLTRIFPAWNGEPITVNDEGYDVIFQERQIPAVNYSHIEVIEEQS